METIDISNLVIGFLVDTLVILVGSYLLPGVKINGIRSAAFVAILLAVVNIILRPTLLWLVTPLTIVTLGLFILVIDALLLMLVDWIAKGFKINSFTWALALSLMLWVVHNIFI